jgi:hypothetical protein
MAGLLSAEPSPELAARVRQALAESEPGRRFAWLWPATAAAVTLLVAVAVWLGHGPSATPRVAVGPGPSRPASNPPTTEPVTVIPRDPRSPGLEGSATVAGPSPSDRAARVPGLVRASPEPEVLVPPGEGEALLRLVALVHRERLSPAALVAAGQPSLDLAELQPIDIKPLEIVPLDPAESSGT